MTSDRSARVVVGAFGPDDDARLVARARLMSGDEVVFIGGGQSAEQVAATARAEDADEVVVDGAGSQLDQVRARLRDLDLDDVRVRACDRPDAPESAESR